MLEYRAMKVSDLDEVLAIEKRSFSNPWSRFAFYNELVHNDYAHYLVALEAGRVVGYGGLWLILDEAHITNIAVQPELRGRGYGQEILTALLGWAKALGARAVTLEVRESNKVAQNLYLKNGFSARGRRRRYYSDNNEDAIVMWKEDLSQVKMLKVGDCCG